MMHKLSLLLAIENDLGAPLDQKNKPLYKTKSKERKILSLSSITRTWGISESLQKVSIYDSICHSRPPNEYVHSCNQGKKKKV